MNKLVCPAIALGLGLFLVLLSTILGWAVLPNIIDNQIEEEIQLVNGTDAWDRFETNPVPVYIEFHVFNITNPDFLEKQELPRVQDFGPYVYEEFRIKNSFEFYDDDTFKYVQNITYVFRPDMSLQNPSLNDPAFTTLNAPFLILSQAIYELGGAELANLLIETLFVEHGEKFLRTGVSADQLIFGGMPLISSYEFVLSMLDEIPPNFSGGRFGFYRGVNETSDGLYHVHNGVRNARDVGRVISWNDEKYLDWWKSPEWHESNKVEDMYCNYLNGSDGSTLPPFTKKTDQLRIFVTDICRSITLSYEKEVEHRDIPGYRFVLAKSFYEDPKTNADNYCFCPSPPEGLQNNCGEGAIRMFPCQDGAPIVASSPHFYLSGGQFLEDAMAMGLNPEAEKHETKIDVEPNTGSVLSIHKRLQISLELQKLPGVNYFNDMVHVLSPVFWVDEYADIDEENADDIKSSLLTPLKIIKISKWTILALGITLIAVASAAFVYLKRR